MKSQAAKFIDRLVIDMPYFSDRLDNGTPVHTYDLDTPAEMPNWMHSQIRHRIGMPSVIEDDRFVAEINEKSQAVRIMIWDSRPFIARPEASKEIPAWSTAHDERPD